MLTDVSIDPAGNVWAANNWNDLNGAAAPDPLRPTSTWGGVRASRLSTASLPQCSRRAWAWHGAQAVTFVLVRTGTEGDFRRSVWELHNHDSSVVAGDVCC
jgi:hypothetical protein